MADFDRGFKEVARRAGRQLARLAGIECDRWTPIVSEVQTTERFADRAFRARRGSERFVVYFEAFTRWDRHAPWNLLAKAGLLSERERLPTRTVVFILQRRGFRSLGGQFRLQVGGVSTQILEVREVPLWEQEPQPWWEETPALMPLYPLCHHGRRPRDAVTHAAGVIRSRIPASIEQADALYLLSIFSDLAYRQLDIEAILGREIMMESRIYRKAMLTGQVDGARAIILRKLEDRFGPGELDDVGSALKDIEDLAILHSLIDLAYTCRNLREFRASIPPRAEE